MLLFRTMGELSAWIFRYKFPTSLLLPLLWPLSRSTSLFPARCTSSVFGVRAYVCVYVLWISDEILCFRVNCCPPSAAKPLPLPLPASLPPSSHFLLCHFLCTGVLPIAIAARRRGRTFRSELGISGNIGRFLNTFLAWLFELYKTCLILSWYFLFCTKQNQNIA